MRILAIETSCDDTGAAILEASKKKGGDFSAQGGPASGWNILSNIVSSQIKVHKKYGGVYPMLAKREHQKNLVSVFKKALKEAKLLKTQKSKIKNQKSKRNKFLVRESKTIESILEREPALYKKILLFLQKYEKPNIDLIAVTNGPGLEPCLWVGVNFAKAISYFWNIPIVPVNHIESHILVNYLNNKKIGLPAIALVASGGHTQLILMKGIGDYKILGETRDDAAGECFDKCAKILGLGYPGGPEIARLAKQADRGPSSNQLVRGRASIQLPRPMINTKDYDFSFSGLKTAVLYADRKIKNKTKKYKERMAAEVQQAVIDVLLKKTIKAAKDFKAKTIILGGGVSANEELRRQLKQKIQKEIPDTKCLIPDTILSTDNALMTAITGFYHRNKKQAWQKIKAKANLRI